MGHCTIHKAERIPDGTLCCRYFFPFICLYTSNKMDDAGARLDLEPRMLKYARGGEGREELVPSPSRRQPQKHGDQRK